MINDLHKAVINSKILELKKLLEENSKSSLLDELMFNYETQDLTKDEFIKCNQCGITKHYNMYTKSNSKCSVCTRENQTKAALIHNLHRSIKKDINIYNDLYEIECKKSCEDCPLSVYSDKWETHIPNYGSKECTGCIKKQDEIYNLYHKEDERILGLSEKTIKQEHIELKVLLMDLSKKIANKKREIKQQNTN